MFSQVVQDALNKQINSEFYSSYSYLAMAAYCEEQQFRGCAHWLRVQSEEEKGHALRLYDFLIAREGKVKLTTIKEPPGEFASLAEVFGKALEQEREVSSQIDALYELAFKEKAFAALVELEWFITEQVEEERTARELVHKFQLIKDDPASLLDLDRELGGRGRAARAAEGTGP